MKKTLMISILALAAVTAFAQEKKAAPAPTPAPAPAKIEELDPVVISADGITVKKSEFEGAIKTLPPEYQQYASGPNRKSFAEDYLRMKILAAQGMKEGLDKQASVQKQLELMRENLVATEEVRKIERDIKVSDDDVKKYFDEHKAEYEQVKARHILIAPKGSPAAPKGDEMTDEQAKAKAEEIRTKLAGGADFAEMAKKESADTGSGQQGGELGTFGHGQMVPEFEKAAFEAKVGDVTPVVKTQFGYHIIKVEEHNTTPLDQVKPTIEKNLKQKKLQEAIDALKNSANAKFDEAYFTPPAPAHPMAPSEKKP